MKELVPRAFDDLDYHESKIRTDAVETDILLGLDGRWYELDLSADHAEELRGWLARWLAAGRGVRGPEERKKEGTRHDTAAVARKRKIRQYARRNGISYITLTGKYYYPVALAQAYERHVAGDDATAELLLGALRARQAENRRKHAAGTAQEEKEEVARA